MQNPDSRQVSSSQFESARERPRAAWSGPARARNRTDNASASAWWPDIATRPAEAPPSRLCPTPSHAPYRTITDRDPISGLDAAPPQRSSHPEGVDGRDTHLLLRIVLADVRCVGAVSIRTPIEPFSGDPFPCHSRSCPARAYGVGGSIPPDPTPGYPSRVVNQIAMANATTESGEPMERVTFRLPQSMIEQLDTHVEKGHFPNRSEAIRSAIRRELRISEAAEVPEEEVNPFPIESSGTAHTDGGSGCVVCGGPLEGPIELDSGVCSDCDDAHDGFLTDGGSNNQQ